MKGCQCPTEHALARCPSCPRKTATVPKPRASREEEAGHKEPCIPIRRTPPPMPPVTEKACAILANLTTEASRSWILGSGPRKQAPCWIGSQRAGHTRPLPSQSCYQSSQRTDWVLEHGQNLAPAAASRPGEVKGEFPRQRGGASTREETSRDPDTQ